jgi:hypothetical protein
LHDSKNFYFEIDALMARIKTVDFMSVGKIGTTGANISSGQMKGRIVYPIET